MKSSLRRPTEVNGQLQMREDLEGSWVSVFGCLDRDSALRIWDRQPVQASSPLELGDTQQPLHYIDLRRVMDVQPIPINVARSQISGFAITMDTGKIFEFSCGGGAYPDWRNALIAHGMASMEDEDEETGSSYFSQQAYAKLMTHPERVSEEWQEMPLLTPIEVGKLGYGSCAFAGLLFLGILGLMASFVGLEALFVYSWLSWNVLASKILFFFIMLFCVALVAVVLWRRRWNRPLILLAMLCMVGAFLAGWMTAQAAEEYHTTKSYKFYPVPTSLSSARGHYHWSQPSAYTVFTFKANTTVAPEFREPADYKSCYSSSSTSHSRKNLSSGHQTCVIHHQCVFPIFQTPQKTETDGILGYGVCSRSNCDNCAASLQNLQNLEGVRLEALYSNLEETPQYKALVAGVQLMKEEHNLQPVSPLVFYDLRRHVSTEEESLAAAKHTAMVWNVSVWGSVAFVAVSFLLTLPFARRRKLRRESLGTTRPPPPPPPPKLTSPSTPTRDVAPSSGGSPPVSRSSSSTGVVAGSASGGARPPRSPPHPTASHAAGTLARTRTSPSRSEDGRGEGTPPPPSYEDATGGAGTTTKAMSQGFRADL